jgi:hypothetical protein
VAEGEVDKGRAGTGRGVDGNQKAVHFAGGGALLGVLSPAALHDDKENGGGTLRRKAGVDSGCRV